MGKAMTACDVFRDSIVLETYGELEENRRCELAAHLRACGECAAGALDIADAALLLADAEGIERAGFGLVGAASEGRAASRRRAALSWSAAAAVLVGVPLAVLLASGGHPKETARLTLGATGAQPVASIASEDGIEAEIQNLGDDIAALESDVAEF